MKFSYIEYVKKVYQKFVAEDISTNSAQVAFYFIFALFPLLLFLVNVVGLFLGAAEDIRNEWFSYLQQVVPSSAIKLVQDTITELTA
ncbi:MAG: YhjD/YihY/BrkB family envelope integrity protein, partial [Aridibacter sp.]